jgi:tRNA-dihydrouridine synthase B
MRIGELELATNLLLAPIAGYTDLAFRLVVRSIGGVGLAATALLSSHGLVKRSAKARQLAATCPDDQPLCVQLFGGDPALMAEAARWACDHGARVIDINMGCPADKVVRGQGGVALMGDPKLATRIADAVVRAVRVPVTVKMRLGCDDDSINAPELAGMLEEVGVQAVTVHGRTARQWFGGNVNLAAIADVVQAVGRIPVIGNGDVRSPQDARDMIDRTGCAGVMIGRRALSDPWIFRDTQAYLTTGLVPPPPTASQRVAAMRDHFEHVLRLRGPRAAVVHFRQRVSWYAKVLPHSRQLRQRMNGINSPGEFHEAIDRYLERQAAQTPDLV